MSDSPNIWPLPDSPASKTQVVLASQGIRIWTAICSIDSFDGSLWLVCSDTTTIRNLRRQQRVAFTILGAGSGKPVQGSGMARVSHSENSGHALIQLEPYRISTGEETYEVRLGGWSLVNDNAGADTFGLAFWYRAFRAVTLPLSALPVLLGAGAAFAHGHFNILTLLLALIGTVAVHAGANALADYYDFKNGVDLSRALSSHLGALARERVEPERIFLAAMACFLITALIGLVLVVLRGWPLLIFGLSGLLGAFFYTGRPVSYKYRAMGELMLGILMGPVIVMGSYYVQTRGWDWAVFLLSLALAMLVSSASLANNLRDIPDDRAARIRTLPMLLGVSATKKLYYVLTVLPYLLVSGAIFLERNLLPMALVFISLPQAVRTIQALHSTTDNLDDIRHKSLRNPYPLNSIRLHARFGSLSVVGAVVAGLLLLLP